MDSTNLGNVACNVARDEFIERCPEYAGYCNEACAALAEICLKEGK